LFRVHTFAEVGDTDKDPTIRICFGDFQSSVDFVASKNEFERSWNMNENIAQEVLHELFSSLEALDTLSTAILQFLKRKGIATEEELAPYLEQAGDASNVRWRAARVRIDYLLSSAMKAAEQDARKEPPKTAEDSQKPRDTGTETLGTKETEKNAHGVQETASGGKPEADGVGASAGKDGNHQREENNRTSKPTAEDAA